MDIKRIQAAQKAVRTRRLLLLEKADPEMLRQLSQEIIQAERDFDDDISRQGIIAREVDKTSWKSFTRFGDRRAATPGLILYWIENKAMSLDEQAMWMSENYSMEFHPSELAEFMMAHDRGKSLYPGLQRIDELKRIFKEVAGFHWDVRFAKSHILKPMLQADDIF